MQLQSPLKLALISSILFVSSLGFAKTDSAIVSGQLMKWHTVTLDFTGPHASENDTKNPFLNYRLNVAFTNGSESFTVPGYFAADGNAGESSATDGNIWRVHFTPNKTGTWSYETSFVTGANIAVTDEAGISTSFDGTKGTFDITESDKEPNDFRTKGRLLVSDANYLQFQDSKEYFLKAGTGSPENFLAYNEFDGTYSMKKEHRDGEAHSVQVKSYAPHASDWKTGDPTWQNGKGKNIIGALNYLAEKRVNSVYFLSMNVYGDGQDVWPWINEHERTRFDCSKLDQWAIVLKHMQNKGMLAHILTQETENELLLDLGNTGQERKLYYRELIARFSHQLALIWNLGEENGWAEWSPNAQNTEQRKAMSAYLKEMDPYNNAVVLHTHADIKLRENILMEVLDDENLDGPSFQLHHPENAHAETLRWKKLSREQGRSWILPIDEIGPAEKGALPDTDDADHDDIRANVLWGNLMAGGSGVEWYFGYKYAQNDLNCENWRSRELLWNQSVIAVEFFQNHLPFGEMESMDEMTVSEEDFVIGKKNEIYCIYLPRFEIAEIDLSEVEGTYQISWFNPKTGGELVDGTVTSVEAGSKVKLGLPLSSQNLDWVILLKKS